METEQQAIISIALMAALADGQQSDAETASLATVSREFGEDLFSEVASGDVTLESQVTLLTTPEARPPLPSATPTEPRTKPKTNFFTDCALLCSYQVMPGRCNSSKRPRWQRLQ